MNKMALLLATDAWKKLDAFQRHLSKHPQVVWSAKGTYTTDYLHQIPYPVNLYFFHGNMIGYRARCTDIVSTGEWSLAQTPPKLSLCWWGIKSTLSGIHQLDESPGPHNSGKTLLSEASESRSLNRRGYADPVRSA
jgi:hypothetical protein